MAFGGYADMSNGGHQSQKRKYAIIGVSSVLLIAMVAAVAVGVSRGGHKDSAKPDNDVPNTSTKVITQICQPTDYRETCVKSLSSAAGNTTDPKELIKIAFRVTVAELKGAIANSSTLNALAKDNRTNFALENCRELMEYAIDDLNESFDRIGAFDVSKLDEYAEDLKVWLSGAITYEQTCLDGFENTTGNAAEKMKDLLRTSQELTKNGLAIVSELSKFLADFQISGLNRRLLSEDGLPSWITEGRRRLLVAPPGDIKADIVVAKDGTGKYKTLTEAINEVPKKNNNTFVIYVKAGIYDEHVIINKTMNNIVLIGDGPTATKITGNRNFVDGIPTFKTATVSVMGANFMAKNIGFENSAGAEKHQAVALRVQSDMSIFYNCRMDGYQDTLYAHTHRQFYRDCVITGTIDFIFGNSAVVFQNCTMVVRKPMVSQQCIVTAQGRIDRREPSGIVLQGCNIIADPLYYPLREENRAYLGRPWKEFSRTIIMQTQIGDFIQPEGWLPWMGDFALNSCFYSEIDNKGPGSVQTGRVKWRGVKTLTQAHALQFTPGAFLGGDTWIRPTGVPYVSGWM
jgi:pectinesterase